MLDRIEQGEASGILAWHPDRLARNTVDAGRLIYLVDIRYRGEYYPGAHEPLITKELFDRCQAMMRRKSKPKGRGFKPYLYRGVFRCGECGGFITIETQKGNNYLRCTKKVRPCSQPYVREEVVSQQVAAYLQRVALPAEEADALIGELEEERRTDADARQQTLNSIRGKLQRTDERIGRLTAAYLDEVLSLDEYRVQKNELVKERRGLEDQVIALEKNRNSWLEPAISFITATKQAGILAETGTDEQKRDFLKNLGSNLKISNRHLSVEPRGAWQLVVDQGSVAQHNTAPFRDDAVFFGEPHQIFNKRRGGESKRLKSTISCCISIYILKLQISRT